METKFLPDGFIIWKVELVDDYATTQEPTQIFVKAPNLVLAHNEALKWGRETIDENIMVKSVQLVTDCILDGSKE